MKSTHYFIKHPVITLILNSMILVIGLLCLNSLSLREYPEVSFPVINVSTQYPNASPDLIESTVTNILEDQLAGIEGLEWLTSSSDAGFSSISLLFRPGTSMDKAINATQEAIGVTRSLLPPASKAPRVERQQPSDNLPFIGIAIESPSLGFGELTHYANVYLKNAFRGLQGVTSVRILGQPYTYEINLDPKKLYAFGINADEVAYALAQSNLSLPAGNYQNKIPTNLDFNLKTVADYENLLIKNTKPNPVFLKSLAQIQLKTDDSQFQVRVNGHSGLVLAISRATDANPLEVSQAVRHELQQLRKSLPDDVKIKIIIDQSEFIKTSLSNIKSSIIEAIILVLIIIFIFLRNVKAIIIPLITIPISLLGSLLFLKLCGFSINQMTLLAMVLAVGLVVDDAIIVLEHIWSHMEQGVSAREAARIGAQQIGFAIIAMTLTLASVYTPLAFIKGTIGQFFIEFAVALAGSVCISGIVALTLSPLMCATFLNPNTKQLIPVIDRVLMQLTQYYHQLLAKTLNKRILILLVTLIIMGTTILLYKKLPQEMAPNEDRGLIGFYIPAASDDNIYIMASKIPNIEKSLNSFPEVKNKLTFIGSWGSNVIVSLKKQKQRTRSSEQIVTILSSQMEQIPSTDVYVWNWKSGLPGIGDAMNGSELQLVLSTTSSFHELFAASEQLKTEIEHEPMFRSVRQELQLDTVGYSIKLDEYNLAKLGITPKQIAKTIEIFFSGDKSITFQKDNIIYSLNLKGATSPLTLDELYLTSPSGKRISLGAVAEMKKQAQPSTLTHVNQMRSTTLNVSLAENQSFQQGMNKLWSIAREKLPSQYRLSWTGAAKSFNESNTSMLLLFGLSLVFIYAILSAQFENFIYPLIILFTVPLACSGALLLAYLFGQSINIYTQIGLITLIGLISKHGILIVEFANQLRQKPLSLNERIIQACTLRLRPILMTTGAMIFGVLPLVMSHDAGSESRRAIGIVLLGGLSIGTFFTLFILPTIYCSVAKLIEPFQQKKNKVL